MKIFTEVEVMMILTEAKGQYVDLEKSRYGREMDNKIPPMVILASTCKEMTGMNFQEAWSGCGGTRMEQIFVEAIARYWKEQMPTVDGKQLEDMASDYAKGAYMGNSDTLFAYTARVFRQAFLKAMQYQNPIKTGLPDNLKLTEGEVNIALAMFGKNKEDFYKTERKTHWSGTANGM